MTEQKQLNYFKKKIRNGAVLITDIYPHWMGYSQDKKLFDRAKQEVIAEQKEYWRKATYYKDKIDWFCSRALVVLISVALIMHFFI